MKKPFVIAEVGSNWEEFVDAKDSVQMAKMCGADAVKFQLFTNKELYGLEDMEESPHAMPRDWLPLLKEKADAAGIEFMCSAFSPEGVKAVDPYVKRHKLASSENQYLQLLGAMLETKKPLIYSCGGSNLSEIRDTLNFVEHYFGKGLDITLLYCVAAYPSRSHSLFNIERLKRFGYKVGLSDHSKDTLYTPLSAVHHFGIDVLEKHFRLSRIKDTPDAEHSLDQIEFQQMVKRLDMDPLDESIPYRSPEETCAVSMYNRRAIATSFISEGAPLKLGVNYGYFRSLKPDLKGLPPLSRDLQKKIVPGCLDGLIAKKHFDPGESIGPKDIG